VASQGLVNHILSAVLYAKHLQLLSRRQSVCTLCYGSPTVAQNFEMLLEYPQRITERTSSQNSICHSQTPSEMKEKETILPGPAPRMRRVRPSAERTDKPDWIPWWRYMLTKIHPELVRMILNWRIEQHDTTTAPISSKLICSEFPLCWTGTWIGGSCIFEILDA
jgi:hypothetical protein